MATNIFDATELPDLIRQRMAVLGISQTELANRLADRFGREGMRQSAVWKWLQNPAALTPDKMFALEAELQVPPGTWSKLCGYLPVEHADTAVIDAINQCVELDSLGKRLLILQFQFFRNEARQSR